MTGDELLLETRGSAVHLILNRPDKANALTQAMWDGLPDLIAHAETIPGARVLVLRSTTDKVFSAGADVAEYRENAGSIDWGLANHTRVTAATQALADCRLATVARIAGPCAGGAVGLVTACDLRYSSADALFAVPPTRLGLVYPQTDTARLVDLIGPSATKRLLLTAARMEASWALRVGLVDEVVHLEDLDAAIDQVVAQISGGAPVSVRAMKQTVALAEAGVRSETDVTRALLTEALEHPDHREGTAAFLERRTPFFAD
ncbi:MAG: enoyl-CoA hydratase-related protein [Candidatus Nanopelagicales bacterium]